MQTVFGNIGFVSTRVDRQSTGRNFGNNGIMQFDINDSIIGHSGIQITGKLLGFTSIQLLQISLYLVL
jgi:hypothetical protein